MQQVPVLPLRALKIVSLWTQDLVCGPLKENNSENVVMLQAHLVEVHVGPNQILISSWQDPVDVKCIVDLRWRVGVMTEHSVLFWRCCVYNTVNVGVSHFPTSKHKSWHCRDLFKPVLLLQSLLESLDCLTLHHSFSKNSRSSNL